MENIERKSIYYVDKYIFNDEEDARDYLKSCDVVAEVVMPFYTEDIERYQDLDELGITDEEFEAWEEYNEKLVNKYNITIGLMRCSYEGPEYKLIGSYKDLLKFAKEYASHPTLDNIGDLKWEIEDGIIDVDYDSGEDHYIIGELY